MDTRSAIIEVTARLLAESVSGDVSTRAVCEAAGVQQPVLYRLFGDKDGLLAATVDHVWEQYLGAKRAAKKSDDPLADLRAGWDSHTAFALAHPNPYKLLFTASMKTPPGAAEEALRILRADLERLAAQGRLRVAPEVAAQMVMAANTGVALALVTRPALYPDPNLSVLVRDATHQAILLGAAPTPRVTPEQARSAAAITLRAGLDELTPARLTAAEAALFAEWLGRVQESDTGS